MKIYKVGGAVRDKYLGIKSTEHDWLVVGATAQQLRDLGYQQVGKDFPVFLHPETKEEYALARTERKNGRGYTGFIFDSNPNVTLEEDLARRDLTINAMAEDEHGKLHDPYHGLTDLKNKTLRHVSPAFIEDPVRILRIARFNARFANLGFTIANETQQLLQTMVANGEVDHLVPERVWQECQRALREPNPAVFFHVLSECGALAILFPELVAHYKEALPRLITTSNLCTDPKIRFANLLSVLNLEDIKQLCMRYRVPTEYQELALLTQKNLSLLNAEFTAETILAALESSDALRRPERCYALITALDCLGLTEQKQKMLEQALITIKSISVASLNNPDLTGPAISAALHEARLFQLKKLIS